MNSFVSAFLIVTLLAGCRQDNSATISLNVNGIGEQKFEFPEFPVLGHQIIVVFEMNEGFTSWEDAVSVLDTISIRAIFGNTGGAFQELTLAPGTSDSAGIIRLKRTDGNIDFGWRIILHMSELSTLDLIIEDTDLLLSFPANLRIYRSK